MDFVEGQSKCSYMHSSAFNRKGQFTATYRHWQLAHHTLTPRPRHRQFLAYDEEPSRVLGTQDLRIYIARGYDRL